MKTRIHRVIAILLILLIPSLIHAQGTAFTYQGRMTDNGTNFSGAGQFKFALVTSTNLSHQATATATRSGQFITLINVTFGGSGYVTPPPVTISGGGGSGATAHATLTGDAVTGIVVDNPGSGYTSTPTVLVAAPPPNIFYTTYWSNDGTSVAGSEPSASVSAPVSNGLFTVVLGDPTVANMTAIDPTLFTQPYLQLRIWFNDGANGFLALNPAQNLTAAPYATFANSSSNLLGTLPATQISGTVSSANLSGTYSSAVNLSNANNTFSGSYGGNGGGLTNVNVQSLVVTTSNLFVSAWGYNGYGQATVPPGLTNVTALASGVYHSMALKADGTVVAWGNNASGQTNVPAGLNGVVSVAAGSIFSVALKGDGTVVAWGYSSDGETNVPPGLNNVVAIAAGDNHTLALRSDGTVIAWGYNGAGQTNVPAGLSGVAAIAGGGQHSLVLKSNGTLVAWGDNTSGQTNIPAGLGTVTAIAGGESHSLALKTDGTVVAWGYNGAGVTNVPPGLSNVVAIAGGQNNSYALKADGTLVAWGDNYYGQTSGATFVDGVIALARGSAANHFMVTRKQVMSPVALTDGDNTFSGRVQFNGMILGKVGINTATPQQALHIVVPPGQGEGMEIDSAIPGHSPAIYLNHTDTGGHDFRIASFGNSSPYAAFIVRDDTVGLDRLTIDNLGNFSLGNGNFTVGDGNYSFGTGTLRAELGLGNKFSLGGNGTVEVDSPGKAGGRFFVGDPGNVGIGTATPQASLHVYSANNPTVVRVQSTGTPGFGRLEFASNPQGDPSEWRPGFIQSTDNGNFTGGIAFYVNGTGVANRFATNEVMRIVNGNVGIGTNNPAQKLHVIGNILATGTVTGGSDRNTKENFATVNSQEILNRVAALPITRWSYKADAGITHLGPMAQDFYAAFSVGLDDKHISMVDADGVALAAIQGLNQKVEAGSQKADNRVQKLEQELEQKQSEITELKQRLDALEKMMRDQKSN